MSDSTLIQEITDLRRALTQAQSERDRLQEQVFQGARRERDAENLRLEQIDKLQSERDSARNATVEVQKALEAGLKIARAKIEVLNEGPIWNDVDLDWKAKAEQAEAENAQLRKALGRTVVYYHCGTCGKDKTYIAATLSGPREKPVERMRTGPTPRRGICQPCSCGDHGDCFAPEKCQCHC